MKLYTELAEYYHVIESSSRVFLDEINFLDRLFQKYKLQSILDLGCGTGEHVYAIQQRGYSIFGMDSSQNMLEVAKRRYTQCNFFLGELQKFELERHVDGMICLFGTFNYLISDSEVNQALSKIYHNLKSNGILFLEIWNSIPVYKIKKKPITPVSISRLGNSIVKRNRGFKVSKSETSESLVEVNFIFDLDSKIIKDKHIMRVFTKEEIVLALEKNQFQVLEILGGYHKEQFTTNSIRMLLICKKKFS
jgi:SAM-dependent methyltransferase